MLFRCVICWGILNQWNRFHMNFDYDFINKSWLMYLTLWLFKSKKQDNAICAVQLNIEQYHIFCHHVKLTMLIWISLYGLHD